MKCALLVLIAQLIIPCRCNEPRLASHLILDADGKCQYWYYDEDPDRRNPCINIPGNATPVFPMDTDSKTLFEHISAILDKYKTRIIDDVAYQDMINDVKEMLQKFEKKDKP